MDEKEASHRAHDPDVAPVEDCSFCTAYLRAKPVPRRHGDGASTVVIPAPKPED